MSSVNQCVWQFPKEGAVPNVADRTSHFENDTTFAELMEIDDDASAADYLARSIALSSGVATTAVSRCTTTSIDKVPGQSSRRASRGDAGTKSG